MTTSPLHTLTDSVDTQAPDHALLSQRAEVYVSSAKRLPVIPAIAAEVLRLAEDPECDSLRLAKVISQDQTLALRILAIANSPMYAGPRRIESLTDAVVLLGFAATKAVAVAASMMDVLSKFDLSDLHLWRHSFAVAVAARTVSEKVPNTTDDETFIAGLLHDVGKLIMRSENEPLYREVLSNVLLRGATFTAAECTLFGFDHAAAGAALLQHYKLPDKICKAVAAHHNPRLYSNEADVASLAAVVQMADYICHSQGLTSIGNPEAKENTVPAEALESLNLSENLDHLIEDFWRSYDAEQEAFDSL